MGFRVTNINVTDIFRLQIILRISCKTLISFYLPFSLSNKQSWLVGEYKSALIAVFPLLLQGAAIEERRNRRAAIENSTQFCSSIAAPHDVLRAAVENSTQLCSSIAALLLRRSSRRATAAATPVAAPVKILPQ